MSAGSGTIRLDCACASSRLRAYYVFAGYAARGEREAHGATDTWCAALFEKALWLDPLQPALDPRSRLEPAEDEVPRDGIGGTDREVRGEQSQPGIKWRTCRV